MNNKLGAFIRQIRVERNLTLRQLATRTGISHSYLHVLESGVDPRSKNPVSVSLASLKKLAAGLEVSLDTLLAVADDNGDTRPVAKAPTPPAALDLNGDEVALLPILENLTRYWPQALHQAVIGYYPVSPALLDIPKAELDRYFYLRMKDDSMAPLINASDLVLIKQGPVGEGDLGAVFWAGDGERIRKLHRLPDLKMVTLLPLNHEFDPITRPLAECTVVGQAVSRTGPLLPR